MNLKTICSLVAMSAVIISAGAADKVKLIGYSSLQSTSNNMPLLTWQSGVCDSTQVWIDNIKMGVTTGNRASIVPFPLSFGEHQWHVVTFCDGKAVKSDTGKFIVDDGTLAELPACSQLLRNNWSVIASSQAGAKGATISCEAYQPKGWAKTSLPATVLTALVRNGVYPNPYVAMNNMLIPDMNDEYNSEYDLIKYSHLKGRNPWREPYWFRTEFELGKRVDKKHIYLNLSEINYKADIWLNGIKIADTTSVVGMERSYRLSIDKAIRKSGKNVLAIAIYPPTVPGKPSPEPLAPLAAPGENMGDGRLSVQYTKWDAMGWDWQPAIRDRDMGITEDVFISATNDVEVRDMYISSKLNLPDLSKAELTISADVVNHSSKSEQGTIDFIITNGTQSIPCSIAYNAKANSTSQVTSKVTVKNPKLWYPLGYGEPNLYNITAKIGGEIMAEDTFGIREVATRIGNKERIITVNGIDIYAKGGNWVIDMMLNWTKRRYDREILLTKNANLNLIRVWGPTGVPPKEFFRAADRHGVMVWQDYLNDFWGTHKNTPGYQPPVELFEQISIDITKRLRNHPSLVMWCGGNEGVNPREEILRRNVIGKYDNRDSRFYLKASDNDGLHGAGPYHTLNPRDYFTHHKLNGFSSEIGPSGIPVLQSIEKFIPRFDSPWYPGRFPLDAVWAYHDANDWDGVDTRKFSSYDNLITKFYGKADSTNIIKGYEEYINRCQALSYDAYRASIESINRQLWSNSSGILLWKSNSSWPSLVWQLYDWYMQAPSGYYGAKKASQTIGVQINRDDNSVSAINLTGEKLANTTIMADLFDCSGKLVRSQQAKADIAPNSVVKSDIIIDNLEKVHFLRLQLLDAKGTPIARNIYPLSSTDNLKELNNLPAAKLAVTCKKVSADAKTTKFAVAIRNEGLTPAYLLSVRLTGKESAQEFLPTIWSDNYITLMPGESANLTAEIFNEDIFETPVMEYTTYLSGKTIKNIE